MRWLKTLIQFVRKALAPDPEAHIRRMLYSMRWSDFEIYITDMFHRFGYADVKRTGFDGPDGGKDVVIEHHGKRYLVQCKHWTRDLVGVTLLREFYAVMVENGADGGYFITMAGFTNPAQEYAGNKPIKLVNVNTLLSWEVLAKQNKMTLSKIKIRDPLTPRCESGVMRVWKQGPYGSFWGCGVWPECYCRDNQRKVI